jgi:hypothetical protein
MPLEIGLLVRMSVGEGSHLHAGVVDVHDPLEGLETISSRVRPLRLSAMRTRNAACEPKGIKPHAILRRPLD